MIRRLLACLLLAGVMFIAAPPPPTAAIEAGAGWSSLSFVCPTPTDIQFTWKAVDGAAFYSLQLAGPIDPTINGGVDGQFVRQFGSIEVARGSMTTAEVTLNSGAIGQPIVLTWYVMLGGKKGYLGLVPAQQVVHVPVPCPLTSPQGSDT